MRRFLECLDEMPLIAVLRGLPAEDALAVGQSLIGAGFTVLEVPLRTKTDGAAPLHPEALASLQILMENFGDRAHIAAGTVKEIGDIAPLKNLDVKTFLAPNFNPEVLLAARKQGIDFIPGIETLADGRAAVEAGATGLKVFPCFKKDAGLGQSECRHAPEFIQALSLAVPLPVYPSGGIDWHKAPLYMAAGARAINVGGELYKHDRSINEITERAQEFVRSVAAYAPPARGASPRRPAIGEGPPTP
ncbi:MAG: hypothetical protein M3N08_05065 [Pseudomonadota bacterium]|nr:hypothetical protein [Pseudomonadota bacterium]